MKRICLRSAILTFVAAMLLSGCDKKEQAAPPAPPFPPLTTPPVVQVAKAAPDETPAFQAIAKLEGSTITEVHARITGFLIRQDYQEGASVKPGDLLFEMDARPFQAALDQAKSALADKQAHSAPQAEIDAAQSAVTAAQGNLAATKISAPVGGIAGRAGPGLGDWIGPRTPLTTISTVDPIKAVFALPKKYYQDHSDRIDQVLALSSEGRPETLDLSMADGTPYSRRGTWDSMEHPAANSMGPVNASALFSNPDRVLRPGQYVKIHVTNP